MNKKAILLAGGIGLSLVSMASADNYVYFTGSTAARNSTVQAIANPGTVFDGTLPITIVAQGSTIYYKASYQMISGHIAGNAAGVVTRVKCHWSGSEAGISDLIGVPAGEVFLGDTAVSPGDATTPGPFTSAQAVDLAMADNDKPFSRNPNAAITGSFCGIIPFKLVKEKGSAAGIVNISDAQAIGLLTGGVKTAQLTGNSADTTYTYLSGRDAWSGTHQNMLGDMGYGLIKFAYQVKIASDGSMIDVDGSGSYVFHDDNSPGLYGYSSGGDVATQMGYDLSQVTSVDAYQGTSAHFSIVGYLGYSDAGTAIGNGGTELTFNGVTESTTAIQEGQYAFWGNEYIFKKNSGLNADAPAVFTGLANNSTGINHLADGTSFIDLTTMHAHRNGPLSNPVHN